MSALLPYCVYVLLSEKDGNFYVGFTTGEAFINVTAYGSIYLSMKIRKAVPNNRKHCFEVTTYGDTYDFPYARLEIRPTSSNPIREVYVDKELGNEAFTYVLKSGDKGTVHVDHVLEYNRDPHYTRDLLLYRTTLQVQDRVKKSGLSTREIIRRLGTSASQFYRVMDQKNYHKSFKQLMDILHVLDYEVDFVIKRRVSKVAEPRTSAGGVYSRKAKKRPA